MRKAAAMNPSRAVRSIACIGLMFAGSVFAQQQASRQADGKTLTIDPAEMQKPWTGDLDGMIERRVIRVLTVNSKTIHFQIGRAHV